MHTNAVNDRIGGDVFQNDSPVIVLGLHHNRSAELENPPGNARPQAQGRAGTHSAQPEGSWRPSTFGANPGDVVITV